MSSLQDNTVVCNASTHKRPLGPLPRWFYRQETRLVDSPLVYSSKSQKPSITSEKTSEGFFDNFLSFRVFRSSLQVFKQFSIKQNSTEKGGTRNAIDSFTIKSRRNLRFKVQNASCDFTSQFCLTYHENIPKDGKELKRQLNTFLQNVRNKYGFKYVWILEFQTSREAPHFHVFFDCIPSMEVRIDLANTWNRITSETEEHYKFHSHPKNFIKWQMRSAGYLTKYLEKSNQKLVPEHFDNVGRFWGTTRGIVTSLADISIKALKDASIHYLIPETGEIVRPKSNIKYLYRVIRKYHETKVRNITKKIHGKKRKYKSQITRPTGSIIPEAAGIFIQALRYLERLQEPYRVPF